MYDHKTDYVWLMNARLREMMPAGWEPTTEDPLCRQCGWPKHHHSGGGRGGGTGPLASGLTEDACDGFQPLPLTATQQDRSHVLLGVMRAPVVVETSGLIRAIKKILPALVFAAWVLSPSLAHAQTPSYDVAFWPATTADPNVTAPAASFVNYTVFTCGLAKTARTTGLVINPTKLRFDDPANPTGFDCEILITAQVAALPNDPTQYRASGRQVIGGVAGQWGVLSSDPFSRLPATLTRFGVS
jgi:hypothetical protein